MLSWWFMSVNAVIMLGVFGSLLRLFHVGTFLNSQLFARRFVDYSIKTERKQSRSVSEDLRGF